jgi:hypothetical protein
MCSIFSNSNHQTVERSMSISSTLPPAACESTTSMSIHHGEQQQRLPTSSTTSRRHSTMQISGSNNTLSIRDIGKNSSSFSHQVLQRNEEEKLNFASLSIKDFCLQQSQQEMPGKKRSDTSSMKTSSRNICLIKPRLSFTLGTTTEDFPESSTILSPEDDFTSYKTPEVQRQIRSVFLSSPPLLPLRRDSGRCCFFLDDALLPESILMPVL